MTLVGRKANELWWKEEGCEARPLDTEKVGVGLERKAADRGKGGKEGRRGREAVCGSQSPMSTTHCGSDELDFRLIFGEEATQPFGPADLEPDDSALFYIFNVDQPLSAVNQPVCLPRHGHQSHCSACSASSRLQGYKTYDGTSEVQEPKYIVSGGAKPFECPSIQITSISPNCQQDTDTTEDLHNGPVNDYIERPSRDHLYLHLEPSYREPSLSPSPGSSISSRSWFSDASSCESFSHIYDDVESELNEAAARFTLGSPLASPSCSPRGFPGDETWQQLGYGTTLSPRQSPCHSPRTSVTDENWLSPRPTSRPSSRPTSPCGKRRHSSADICYQVPTSPKHSPTASPNNSPRGSITEDTWISLSNNSVSGVSPSQCFQETAIPLKTRKTSEDQSATLVGKVDLSADDQGRLSPTLDTPTEDNIGSPHPLKKDSSTDQFLSVPSHFTWNKPKSGHTPIFRTSSLPPLDWPLPNHYGQCELKVEVQPKTHHRAHYETEGSRGAVKAVTGGHPVVKLIGYTEKPINLQMFIGTADDRYLRPHAFYQVHRITGKTVATASQEIIITSTKVLEIPLLPENSMCASIDCAGILKLRNSDIELRKGETDIGRKNTRVRLVFRVHIPQPSGKVLSLQTASIPIECSQRSAQELPQVDKYNISSCTVTGGTELIITGSNILSESKVIFVEKGQDGRPQWEVEAKIVAEKRQMTEIVVEIPPYHNKSIVTGVQVQFYLCNGKRKRSQSQRFTYTPVLMKREHTEEDDVPAASSVPVPQVVNVSGQQALHSYRPTPDQRPSHGNLMSSQDRGLGYHAQPAYSSVNHGVPSLSQGRNVNGRAECLPPALQQSYHVSASAARSSYTTMQSNVMYNGQSSLPLNSASAQRYEQLSFQQEAGIPHLVNLSHQSMSMMQYHTATAGTACSSPAIIDPLVHAVQSSHQSGFHCSNTGQSTIPSTSISQSIGHPPLPLPSVSYHLTKLGPTSSPTNAAPHPLIHSPLPSPSSQLKPMPYQSPTSGAPTPSPSPNSMIQSGQLPPQTLSPGQGSIPSTVNIGHHSVQDTSPFHPDDASPSVKPEPEDGELNFQTIGLQDITLDDVNEIIGRDMSDGVERTQRECHKPVMSNILDTV
ncbi:nuclear factor of activated T-cells, cytoplasmic 3 [Mixophyes fleayi]|uniref:nuclear factor of activated T-cells, cytoplasmic 3 n=1 Tax=Mixophyes fleayi TaxID=3061075 RepID=UPI003F4E06A8